MRMLALVVKDKLYFNHGSIFCSCLMDERKNKLDENAMMMDGWINTFYLSLCFIFA